MELEQQTAFGVAVGWAELCVEGAAGSVQMCCTRCRRRGPMGTVLALAVGVLGVCQQTAFGVG